MAKKDYIVIRKNCLDHKVGATIKLDDTQAKNLVGKVKLKKDIQLDAKAQEGLTELTKENKALKAEVEGLKSDLAEIDADSTKLADELKAANAEIEKLTKAK